MLTHKQGHVKIETKRERERAKDICLLNRQREERKLEKSERREKEREWAEVIDRDRYGERKRENPCENSLWSWSFHFFLTLQSASELFRKKKTFLGTLAVFCVLHNKLDENSTLRTLLLQVTGQFRMLKLIKKCLFSTCDWIVGNAKKIRRLSQAFYSIFEYFCVHIRDKILGSILCFLQRHKRALNACNICLHWEETSKDASSSPKVSIFRRVIANGNKQ